MAKRRRKKKTHRLASKMHGRRKGRRRTQRGRRKGHIPLPVLEKRLKRLSKIVASRK